MKKLIYTLILLALPVSFRAEEVMIDTVSWTVEEITTYKWVDCPATEDFAITIQDDTTTSYERIGDTIFFYETVTIPEAIRLIIVPDSFTVIERCDTLEYEADVDARSNEFDRLIGAGFEVVDIYSKSRGIVGMPNYTVFLMRKIICHPDTVWGE